MDDTSTNMAKKQNSYGGAATISKSGPGIEGRMMPESLVAEAAVLASMVVDPVCIGDVIE